MRLSLLLLSALALASNPAAADESRPPNFLLRQEIQAGDSTEVSIRLELGGEMILNQDQEGGAEPAAVRLPLSVVAKLNYQEQLLAWPDASATEEKSGLLRSVRHYSTASATIKIDQQGTQRKLAEDRRTLVAEIRDNRPAINGIESALTRDELDLVSVVGNTLVLDRLLPGRKLAEGESWDHEAAVFGPLLGMDHVAACEVRSVVTGLASNHVQIRMAGTVHGTVDGAATEIQLRGAYLFNLQRKRITKFNLAMKEKRSAGEVAPGLDVVAKLIMEIGPLAETSRRADTLAEKASAVSRPVRSDLAYESTQAGYRFLHDTSWYVTAEQREIVSLRRLQQGELTAHCNIISLPPRSEGHGTTLEEFQRDIQKSLGKNLSTVTAATTWTTAVGHDCLGVIARGTMENVPIEWRYYLISQPDLPRVSIAVTVEASRAELFDDADRRLVDSLELLAPGGVAASERELVR